MKALSTKSRKSLTYSIFIIVVLSVFLLGYFFYFIPKNKETINNNGFLILKTISNNISEKTSGRLAYYKNISVKSNQQDKTVQQVLKQNKIGPSLIARGSQDTDGSAIDSVSGTASISDDGFVFSVINHSVNDTNVFIENFRTFLSSILATQKQELFSGYAVVRVNAAPYLLYHDEDFAMRYDIKSDSLLPKNVQGYLAGIRDINSSDYDHKMFYYPFKVDSLQLVLCGFVKTGDYNGALRKVPFGFVYPLAIAFLLLIAFLPILKFYLMDSNEQIHIRDLYLFGLSVFFGAAMVTLIIIQFLLRMGEQDRVTAHLKSISTQVENNFYSELNTVLDQMTMLDEVRKKDSTLRKPIQGSIDYSEQIKTYLGNLPQKNPYPFDRISWIDSTGMQVIKAEMKGVPVFTNVKERDYFKAITTDHPYSITMGNKTRTFGFEPIYSWTNGDFNISISQQSDDYVVAMASKMNSVVNVLMPTGYKFCVIDDQGNVLLHADANRNLRENLFEKTTGPEKIKKAIAARQVLDLPDVTMYNNQRHILHLRPLKGLPYSLVTFYDKGYIAPVSLRILIFALIFFCLSAFICLTLWGLLARGGLTRHTLLYCPMNCMHWISPQQREANYYAHGAVFIVIYLILFLVFVSLHRSDVISNFTIFSLVLFTPVNIVGVLFSIRVALSANENKIQEKEQLKVQRKTIWIAIAHLLLSVAFFLASLFVGLAIGVWFVVFQLIFSFWIWYYRYNKLLSTKMVKVVSTHYKMGYSIVATSLIICLSVLPCGLFTWYAHNQEFIQAVKKQQLHLAKGLQQRMQRVYNNPVLHDTSIVSTQVTNDIVFKKGIYKLYNDSALLAQQPWKNVSANESAFESFYFEIAEDLATSYTDPQVYPALENSSADNSWLWNIGKNEIELFYQPAFISSNLQYINVISTIPSRFLFLKGLALLWLIPIIALLVYALYKWLRINTDSVFLVKYIDTYKVVKPAILELITEYNQKEDVKDTVDPDVLSKDDKYIHYTQNTNEVELNLYEPEVLKGLPGYKGFFDFVWNKCTPKEKYLLFDFAVDGLINYKNTTEIYSLLSKGILVVEGDKLRVFNTAFRAYLILKTDSDEVNLLHKQYHHNSSWQAIKRPLLLLLLGGAVLIFFTQEAMFQKVLAVAGGLGTLISLLPKIFSSITNKPEAPAG